MALHPTEIKELCEILDIPTLETRHSDSLDFHDLPVWMIEKALNRAYEMGRQDGMMPFRKSTW